MNSINQVDTFHMYLSNRDGETSESEFTVQFPRLIELHRPMECALIEANFPSKIETSTFTNSYEIKLKCIYFKSDNKNFLAEVEKVEKVTEIDKYIIEPGNYTLKKLFDRLKTINALANQFIDLKNNEHNTQQNLMTSVAKSTTVEYPRMILWRGSKVRILGGAMINKYEPMNFELVISPGIEHEQWDVHNTTRNLLYGKIKNKITKKNHLYDTYTEAGQLKYKIDPYPGPYGKNKPSGTLRGYTEEEVLRAIYFFEISQELHELFGYALDQYPLYEYDEKKEINFFWPSNLYDEYLIRSIIQNPVKLEIDVDTLFVYCDILKESYVGNMKVNILRIFPRIKSSIEDKITYNFNNLVFIPLRVENIDSITISIRNYMGEKIKFDGNDISLLLEIRPIEHK